MQDEVKVTQADIDAWEIYGPKIFHCEMTGPEALARHRHQAEQRGGEVVAYVWTDPTHQRPPELNWHCDMGPPYDGWIATPLTALGETA